MNSVKEYLSWSGQAIQYIGRIVTCVSTVQLRSNQTIKDSKQSLVDLLKEIVLSADGPWPSKKDKYREPGNYAHLSGSVLAAVCRPFHYLLRAVLLVSWVACSSTGAQTNFVLYVWAGATKTTYNNSPMMVKEPIHELVETYIVNNYHL